jgi:hypothetical protein
VDYPRFNATAVREVCEVRQEMSQEGDVLLILLAGRTASLAVPEADIPCTLLLTAITARGTTYRTEQACTSRPSKARSRNPPRGNSVHHPDVEALNLPAELQGYG